MNQELKEQAHKEFDKKFEEHKNGKNSIGIQYIDAPETTFKSFIDSIIDKTVQHEQDRIVEIIEDWTPTKYTGYGVSPIAMTLDDHKRNFSKELISLITNKSDINKDKE